MTAAHGTEWQDMDNPLSALRRYLSGLPSGTVKDRAETESLLFRCWNDLDGNQDGGMIAYKLVGRTEKMKWNPPMLTFLIERHGATTLGSTYAELQGWKIDVDSGTAAVAERIGRRVVGTRQPRLDVEPMAEEIVALILAGTNDERLKWCGDSKVRIWVRKLIPDQGPQQTVRGSRKRLAEAIEGRLKQNGWRKVIGVHTYEKIGEG